MQSNPVQMLFGTFLLFFGWFSFNGGSAMAVPNCERANDVAIMCL